MGGDDDDNDDDDDDDGSGILSPFSLLLLFTLLVGPVLSVILGLGFEMVLPLLASPPFSKLL